jgi:hypothetical protein
MAIDPAIIQGCCRLIISSVTSSVCADVCGRQQADLDRITAYKAERQRVGWLMQPER